MTLAAVVLAAALPSADIAAYAERVLREAPEVTSVGLAAVRDGHTVIAGGFGLADAATGRPANAGTGYYIASATKSYTGLACAILASRGVLDLDAPITRYLPKASFPGAEDVTLRKLLTHSAPFENDPIVFRTAFTGEHTPSTLLSLLNSSTAREEGFKYDNIGYVVASMILESVTGKPWQKVLDEVVFTPLKMTHTTAYMSEARRRPLASPHDLNRRAEVVKLSFQKNDQMMHAAGGIVTTPRDLARWLVANTTNQTAPWREAHRKQVEAKGDRDDFKTHGYALGWFVARYGDEEVLFHLGGFEGWRAHVSFMPSRRIGVAVVTNSGSAAGSALNVIAAYAYDRLLNKPEAESAGEERLSRFKTAQRERRERLLAEAAKRAQRPWSLARANSVYAGTYESAALGTLIIVEQSGKLQATLGPLSSVVEAFTEPETARVELIPGTGEVLRFVFSTADRPEAVKLGAETFVRR